MQICPSCHLAGASPLPLGRAWGISSQLLQSLPSYWTFSDLGHGVSPHGCSSADHLTGLSLTLAMGYLLTAAPAPTILLDFLWPWLWGISSWLLQRLPSYWTFSDLGCGVSPHSCSSATQLPYLNTGRCLMLLGLLLAPWFPHQWLRHLAELPNHSF